MRICYIGDAPSPHVQKWARHFAREHEVHVISFRPAVVPGLQVHALEHLGFLGKARYPLEAPGIRRLLRRLRPDVVHALHLTSYGFVAALAGAHPLITSVWGYDILQAPHRTPLHSWITRYALASADIVTATGDALAEETRPFVAPGRDIHVVPYGIDLDVFRPGKNGASGVTIGSVKALVPEKGFEYLIGAMPAVLERYPDTRLVLAGDGPELRRLEQLAQRLGVGAKVEFAREIPHDAVPEFVRALDAFVQPSLTESFGVSALEASATAIPVIASDVEGGRDIMRDGQTGMLVPPGSSEALSTALLSLLDHPERRRAMGEAGRAFVAERYNWQDNAAAMQALYTGASEAYRGCHR